MNETEKQERLLRLMEEEQKALQSGDDPPTKATNPTDPATTVPSTSDTLDQSTSASPKTPQGSKESEILNWLKKTEQKRAEESKKMLAVLKEISQKKTVGLDWGEKIAFMAFMIFVLASLNKITSIL